MATEKEIIEKFMASFCEMVRSKSREFNLYSDETCTALNKKTDNLYRINHVDEEYVEFKLNFDKDGNFEDVEYLGEYYYSDECFKDIEGNTYDITVCGENEDNLIRSAEDMSDDSLSDDEESNSFLDAFAKVSKNLTDRFHYDEDTDTWTQLVSDEEIESPSDFNDFVSKTFGVNVEIEEPQEEKEKDNAEAFEELMRRIKGKP